MKTPPAISVLEFDSVAVGTRVADAMVKKAPIEVFRVGTVHPGKYVVLSGGSVAAVEESHVEGLRLGGPAVTDAVLLPDVHPEVYTSAGGERRANTGDALGVIETSGIASNIAAADASIKAARVTIVEIRLGDGLGGKGLTQITGVLHEVEAALAAGLAAVTRPGITKCHAIIPAQHDELRDRVARTTEFHS